MSFSFASLGSGSRGNATLIRSENALLLVDNGFTLKETERRLAKLGHCPEDISAILVTHEHGDHIKGVGPLARKYQLPVYLTHGTAQYQGLNNVNEMHQINIHRIFTVEDIDITPVAVPHDAREPCQFVFRHADKTIGLLTDLGSITPHVTEQYQHCDALMLECNHCPELLAMGQYPASLKQRVGGHWGHLSNHQAANLLEQIDVERIQHLVISHISENNNTEALAKAAVTKWYSQDLPILAKQDEAIDWLAVN